MGETFALLPCTQWMPLRFKIPHLQQQSCRGKITCSPLLLRAACEVKGGRGGDTHTHTQKERERAVGGGSQSSRLAVSPWLLEGEEDEGHGG
jgi:hypothetical protein